MRFSQDSMKMYGVPGVEFKIMRSARFWRGGLPAPIGSLDPPVRIVIRRIFGIRGKKTADIS